MVTSILWMVPSKAEIAEGEMWDDPVVINWCCFVVWQW
jgi:hypothetical protein